MDLSKVNGWLSLVANLGVLFGIFFLVIEINQNTKAIGDENSWARVSTANDTYAFLVGNEELPALLLKYRGNPNLMEEPLTPELIRYLFFLEMVARQNEARFLTDSDSLGVLRASSMRSLLYPGPRGFYKSQLEGGFFTQEYGNFIAELIGEIEGN